MISITLRPGKQNAFHALGQVKNLEKLPEFVRILTGIIVTIDELENNVKQNFIAGDILYFERNSNQFVQVDQQTEATSSFAVYTGYKTRANEKLYAQYQMRTTGWSGVKLVTKQEILDYIFTYDIGSLRFKGYDEANTFISTLHEMLMPGEEWVYEGPEQQDAYQKTNYSILQSYLKIISSVLVYDWNDPSSLNYNKVVFSSPASGQPVYALFNTGLLSDRASDIYVYGTVGSTTPTTGRFWINNPTILLNGLSEIDGLGFAKDALDQAQMVSFFKEINDILFDANRDVDTVNYRKLKHCIDDGIKRARFPEEFKAAWEDGYQQYVITAFKAAIENSLKIAKRNYKYVVPQYRLPDKPGDKGTLQFLMPIYLKVDYKRLPDFALVLSKRYYANSTSEFYYVPETILALPWAYSNARAICKPDNTWLDPDKFKDLK